MNSQEFEGSSSEPVHNVRSAKHIGRCGGKGGGKESERRNVTEIDEN